MPPFDMVTIFALISCLLLAAFLLFRVRSLIGKFALAVGRFLISENLERVLSVLLKLAVIIAVISIAKSYYDQSQNGRFEVRTEKDDWPVIIDTRTGKITRKRAAPNFWQ